MRVCLFVVFVKRKERLYENTDAVCEWIIVGHCMKEKEITVLREKESGF